MASLLHQLGTLALEIVKPRRSAARLLAASGLTLVTVWLAFGAFSLLMAGGVMWLIESQAWAIWQALLAAAIVAAFVAWLTGWCARDKLTLEEKESWSSDTLREIADEIVEAFREGWEEAETQTPSRPATASAQPTPLKKEKKYG